MKSTRLPLLAALVVLFLIPIPAVPEPSSAQEMSAEEKQMIEMMQKQGTPGKHHGLNPLFIEAAGDAAALEGKFKPLRNECRELSSSYEREFLGSSRLRREMEPL